MASRFEQEILSAHRPRSAAELAACGVTRDMTRGRSWRRTSRGFFTPTLVSAVTPTQRVLDVAPLVPGTGALSGWAAAYVQGVDLLDGLDSEMVPQPVLINLGRDLGRASTDRILYRRERLAPLDRHVRCGLSVTTPTRTAFDGARWAPNLVEAVVFLDQLTHVLPINRDQVTSWCGSGARWAGLDQFRKALSLSDSQTRSPWETRLRLFATQRAGLPQLLVNQPVFDLEERFLGIPDLLDPEAGLVLEFDGQDHRKRRQHQSDNVREEKLELANLTVCRVDSLDLRQSIPLIERLQARRAQGLARDRGRDRWTLKQPAWWLRRHPAGSGSQRG